MTRRPATFFTDCGATAGSVTYEDGYVSTFPGLDSLPTPHLNVGDIITITDVDGRVSLVRIDAEG